MEDCQKLDYAALFDQFKRHKQYLDNVSPATMEGYAWAWKAFADVFKSGAPVAKTAFVDHIAALRLKGLLTISQWADKYRTLSQRASAEPGPWRTDRTPYLRDIMDCLSPASPIERTVFMKGAQIGGTECGNNWIGYVIHQAPGPMMAVQPTVEMAKRNSKQRIDPLLEESEALRALVSEAARRSLKVVKVA